MSNQKSSSTVRILCEGAVMTALSAALSFLALRLWPQGGSVDLVMIPLILFAIRQGTLWGIGAGFVYGLIDCILSGGIGWGWQSILLDYTVAYAMVGLAGLFPRRPLAAVLTASAARLLIHILAGVLVWSSSMPAEFLGMPMTNIWWYSLLYNGSYMVLNALLAGILVPLLLNNPRLQLKRR